MKWSRYKGWLAPIAVLVVACVGYGVIQATHHARSSQASPKFVTPLPSAVAEQQSMVDQGTNLGGAPAPAFQLKDQFGKSVSLSQFKGKVVVLAFVDSKCTTICPLTTADMMNAIQQLGPKAAKQIQLIGIDANPDATSISDVMKYSQEHNMVHSWDFLTGSLKQLHAVWNSYHINSQIVKGQIDHTPALYVIDPQGKERVLYMTPSTYSSVGAETSILANDISKYLPAHNAQSVKSVTTSPATTAIESGDTIPRVTDGQIKGTIQLASKSPTLLAFFGTWAPEAKSELEQLGQYARHKGAPRVIAIDVQTTEPSQSWVLNWEKQVQTNGMPIGIDTSGRIADALNVTDLMWLTLINSNGKVVWHHDGPMPIKQIQAIVQGKLEADTSGGS